MNVLAVRVRLRHPSASLWISATWSGRSCALQHMMGTWKNVLSLCKLSAPALNRGLVVPPSTRRSLLSLSLLGSLSIDGATGCDLSGSSRSDTAGDGGPLTCSRRFPFGGIGASGRMEGGVTARRLCGIGRSLFGHVNFWDSPAKRIAFVRGSARSISGRHSPTAIPVCGAAALVSMTSGMRSPEPCAKRVQDWPSSPLRVGWSIIGQNASVWNWPEDGWMRLPPKKGRCSKRNVAVNVFCARSRGTYVSVSVTRS